MNRLDPVEYLRLFESEAAQLATVAPADLGTDVPHIEGWTVHNVVGHTGWICRYVVECLQSTPEKPPSRSSVGEPPVGAEVLEWYSESVDLARKALKTTDVETLRPTFTGAQPAAWWLRRVSHEVSMHRWDAMASIGRPEPIDSVQARDGIDEVLEVFAPNRLNFDALGAGGETIHLHSTDLEDGEWLLDLGPEALEWQRGHAKGDVAARGTTSDLLLLMWSRIPPGRLEVFGDAELLHRWQTAAAF